MSRSYKDFCKEIEEYLNRLIFNKYKSIELMERIEKLRL